MDTYSHPFTDDNTTGSSTVSPDMIEDNVDLSYIHPYRGNPGTVPNIEDIFRSIVPVQVMPSDLISFLSYSVPPFLTSGNRLLQIVPRMPKGIACAATIIAQSGGSAIALFQDEGACNYGQAFQPSGFQIPLNVPIRVATSGGIWAGATSVATTVSVMIERYTMRR